MKFTDKTFLIRGGNCEFSIYENDFEINDNTLIKYDGDVGISNNILLLNETTLKYSVQNQELTYTKL
ncbi:MAG TPA: hypothetical protein ENK91_00490 [Bacteroidetes bacterium]|nr:hypothetical protein [Bacteroidota bacterium]